MVQDFPVTPVPVDAERLDNLRLFTHFMYVLFAICWLTGGISPLIAVIVAYLKRSDAAGTLYASHFRWLIRTFWGAVAVGLICGLVFLLILSGAGLGHILGLGVLVGPLLLIPMLLGPLVVAGLMLWLIYRIAKGWLRLADGRPMYGGNTLSMF